MPRKWGVFLFCLSFCLLTVFLGGCVNPLELRPDKAPEDAKQIPFETYISVHIAPSAQGSRSVTIAQAESIVNFYELIVNKLDSGPGHLPTPVFASDSVRRGQGSLTVPVEYGAWYNVMLLEGYMPPDGGQPVLLRSGMCAAPVQINIRGANPVPITRQTITLKPFGAPDSTYQLSVDGSDTFSRRKDGMLCMVFPRRNNVPNDYNTVKLRAAGMAALHGAGAGAASLEPVLYLKPYLSVSSTWGAGILDTRWDGSEAWNGANAGYAMTGVNNDEAEITWTIPRSAFPALRAYGLVYFEMKYKAWNANLPNLTEWTIRGGLDNGLDYPNNSGGAMLAGVGGGLEDGWISLAFPPVISVVPGSQALTVRMDSHADPIPADYTVSWVQSNVPLTTPGDITGHPQVQHSPPVSALSFPYAIPGALTNGQDYYIVIQANAPAFNPYSNVAKAVPGIQNLSTPVIGLLPVNGGLQVNLNLAAYPAADSYDLYWRQGVWTSAAGVMSGTGSASQTNVSFPYDITPLPGGTKYTVIVAAKKTGYHDTYSNRVWAVTGAGWQSNTATTFGGEIMAITWSGSRWAAVGRTTSSGQAGHIAWSDDGVNWTTASSGSFSVNMSVGLAWGNGKFVLGSGTSSGQLMYSSDGITWTNALTVSGSFTVGYGGGNFIAAGTNGQIYSSANGVNWNQVSAQGGQGGSSSLLDIATDGSGIWMAVGTNGTIIKSVNNGANWSAVTSAGAPGTDLHGIAADGSGNWVAAGGGGWLAFSSDNGQTWSPQTSQFSGSMITHVVYANNQWVALGTGGKMSKSADGKNWTAIPPAATLFSGAIFDIDWDGSKWVAAGAGGRTAYGILP